jgi:putative ABC transport system permease protein
LLTESVLLAALGAIGGLVVAHWGTRGLVALIASPTSPVALDLGMSARVLGFTALAATITVVLFGLVPAWRGTRVDPQTTMRAAGRGVAEGGSGRFTLGKALVAVQVALSLTLLVGAGLLVGTLRNLVTMDPGFRAEGVLVAQTNYSRADLPQERRREARRALLERVRAIPGVRSASASDIVPLGRSSWNDALFVDGFTAKSLEDRFVWFNEVSDAYFSTMGTRLLAGRDFSAGDVPGSPRVAIVSQSVADKFFGGDPLGKSYRLKRGEEFEPPVTVVGVVADAKYQQLREKQSGTVYLPASQAELVSGVVALQLRADDDASAAALAGPVKAAVAELHPLATVEFRTLTSQIAGTLQREKVLALLSALFGAMALGLSMLGLYGIMAYSVARRRNEIGVRIALGAASTRVVGMVLGDVARVVAIGAVIGIAGALAAGKLVASFLYGMEASDPFVLAGATAMLVAVALLAGFIPALKASRVDPVAALRED